MTSEHHDSKKYLKTVNCEVINDVGIGKVEPKFETELEDVTASYSLALNDEIDLFNFKRKDEPTQMELGDVENNILSCMWCNFITSDAFEFATHQRVHSTTNLKRFECYHCPYKTCSRNNFIQHVLHHTDLQYQCNECTYKTGLKGRLRTHLLIHIGVKKYECDCCAYKTVRKCDLTKHSFKHTGIKKYKCLECDHRTTQKSSLKLHMFTHTRIKKYECDQCDYKTNFKSHLNGHSAIHATFKKYQCGLCEFKTKIKRSLNSHFLSKHTTKPKRRPHKIFQCHQCDFKTLYGNSLKLHVAQSHVKTLQCTYCEYKTNLKSTFEAHLSKHRIKKYEVMLKDYLNQRPLKLQNLFAQTETDEEVTVVDAKMSKKCEEADEIKPKTPKQYFNRRLLKNPIFTKTEVVGVTNTDDTETYEGVSYNNF